MALKALLGLGSAKRVCQSLDCKELRGQNLENKRVSRERVGFFRCVRLDHDGAIHIVRARSDITTCGGKKYPFKSSARVSEERAVVFSARKYSITPMDWGGRYDKNQSRRRWLSRNLEPWFAAKEAQGAARRWVAEYGQSE
jgi:hypothetical protein